MYLFTNDLQIRGTKDTSCLHKWDINCKYWSIDEENSSLFFSFSSLKLFKITAYKLLSYPENVFPLKFGQSPLKQQEEL